MFAVVRTLLEGFWVLLKAGTIVHATILAAPSSTKNASGTRNPEIRQARKGQQWFFGMKMHVGTDTRGLVQTVTTTTTTDATHADIARRRCCTARKPRS